MTDPDETRPPRPPIVLGRSALLAWLLLCSTIARPTASAGPTDPVRPNLVLILADDLGWAELGCYGNTFNRTPHLDALARQGMRFTNAYAPAPVCSPTRVALMTGLYPARVGINDYLRPDDPKYLSPDYETLPERLRARGYATGLIGKWHLTGYSENKGAASLHGFDEVLCSETSGIGGGDYVHPYRFMPALPARAEGEYLTDRLADEAVDFIGRHRDRPFFLDLSHYAVHTRLEGKPELVREYASRPEAGKDRDNPELAAMLESIDDGVGRIVEALDKHGIADRTILAFTSDNGGETRVTSNAPLRGGKSQLYEGGIREPLIVRWPGTIAAGSTSEVPVWLIDLVPTFLEAAGAPLNAGESCDGEGLISLFRGEGTPDREALFWHYPLEAPHFLGGRSAGAIRRGDLKLIEFFDTGSVELYDLAHDPGESRDLAADRPEEARDLRDRLARWRREVGAETPPIPGR